VARSGSSDVRQALPRSIYLIRKHLPPPRGIREIDDFAAAHFARPSSRRYPLGISTARPAAGPEERRLPERSQDVRRAVVPAGISVPIRHVREAPRRRYGRDSLTTDCIRTDAPRRHYQPHTDRRLGIGIIRMSGSRPVATSSSDWAHRT
jgi:hypothetical protein